MTFSGNDQHPPRTDEQKIKFVTIPQLFPPTWFKKKVLFIT